MKLGAQEPHRTNLVSAPAKAAAAAALLRRENHTSGAAPRGAAPRAPRRRARCSGAAAPRRSLCGGRLGGRAAARGWAGEEEEERSYVRKKQEKHAEAEERGVPRGWQSMCAFTWQRRPSAAPRCGFPLRSHSNARSENETQWESGKEAYSGGWAVPPPPPRPLSAPPPIALPARLRRRGWPRCRRCPARPGPAARGTRGARTARPASCARPGSAVRRRVLSAAGAGRGAAGMGLACGARELAERGGGRRESPRVAVLVRRRCLRGERRKRSVTTVWPSSGNCIFRREWESLVVSHFLIKEWIWTSKAICFPVWD